MFEYDPIEDVHTARTEEFFALASNFEGQPGAFCLVFTTSKPAELVAEFYDHEGTLDDVKSSFEQFVALTQH
ncbi:hypothetical protein [Rhodococcus phage RGL3]|uniref:Uncharacterized protein n=1 Tax=Rhodococcus phage RGL3 TaxID=2922221 RepID=G9FHQ5_9CAUD|nr:hypothetical protein RoPhRGL3_gp63 [Rhodococcus phage RGL3]AEV52143.1 hypothetical protein [Rhodococcus phage RGL3]